MKKGKIMMAVCFILAIICIVYGIFVRAADSGTAFFMVWILGGICLLIAGILLRKGVLQRLPRIWRIVFGGLLAAGVILFLVVEGLILGSFHEKGEKGLSYLLVLGSQVYADGPSLVLQYRLDTAIGYLKENPETICIVSGGQGYNEPMTEAEGMARYLEQNGIAAERILLEDQSKTTQQNMEFSRKLIPEGASWVLSQIIFIYIVPCRSQKDRGWCRQLELQLLRRENILPIICCGNFSDGSRWCCWIST